MTEERLPLAELLRKLGKSDVMLPQIGFGAAPLGELFARVSEADAEATLATAWDSGVRYYDTAPWYGQVAAQLAQLTTGGYHALADLNASGRIRRRSWLANDCP